MSFSSDAKAELCQSRPDKKALALAEAYFETAATLPERTGCDIVAHFDLIAKFNEGNALFNGEDPRYRAAWRQAADTLLEDPFEPLPEVEFEAGGKGGIIWANT